jgi:CheY-like chemotaxis protein
MTAPILFVDDSGESVKLLQRALTSEYLELITALDGAEALAKIAECRPDIVLVDAMMLGIDGLSGTAPSSSSMPTAIGPWSTPSRGPGETL